MPQSRGPDSNAVPPDARNGRRRTLPRGPISGHNDWPTLIAIAGVCVGWFVLDAVALRLGHFINSFRFYDLAALIYRPSRLITGSSASDWPLTIPFVAACVAAIAATLAPRFSRERSAWYGLCAPLALMVLSCVVLYVNVAKAPIVAMSGSDEFARTVNDLAAKITHRASDVLAHHLTASAGLWVSAIAAVYLAVTGVRRARAHPEDARPPGAPGPLD